MQLNRSLFTKETLLDLTVNIIPLGILAFMGVLYLVVMPWGYDEPLMVIVSHGLIIIPFVGLSLLTYVAADRIEAGESGIEE